MARHQASMTQYNKLVCVAECPAEVNDNIPLNQLINQLEIIDPLHHAIMPQQNTSKTVLPLLWKIDSDVPDHLMGDTMRLTQILLNLCSNAVKVNKNYFLIYIYSLSLVYQIWWHSCKNYKIRSSKSSEMLY